tara:strand:+ start:536 stop:1309 length:774 start_codon:yes stop_codon:yes gene_type:complete
VTSFIHPTALISPSAKISSDVKIGPFTIIEDNVVIKKGSTIKSSVHICKNTIIGEECQIFQSAVIGEIPQDLKYDGEETSLRIGDRTKIREFCTINKGTKANGETSIGNDCLLMAYVHVAHDCIIGDNTVLANGVQLGGHVEIGNWVTIGGMTPVHQFTKIGDYAFIGGGYRVVQDIPPYILAMGEPLKYAGVNSVGLRRRGFAPDIRDLIKKIYKIIFKSDTNISESIKLIKKDFKINEQVDLILKFIENSSRGLI